MVVIMACEAEWPKAHGSGDGEKNAMKTEQKVNELFSARLGDGSFLAIVIVQCIRTDKSALRYRYAPLVAVGVVV